MSIPIVTVETGVHRGKPLQRILGYQAYTNPAAKLSQIVLSIPYTYQGSWYSTTWCINKLSNVFDLIIW